MASPSCWRCLARPSQRLLLVFVSATVSAPTSTAAFSTSAHLSAKTSSESSRHFRAGKRLILGTKRRRNIDKSKPPQPGERKAFRKRIQLSNDNALEVPGLGVFSPDLAVDPESIGKVVGIPTDPAELIDQLRACEAFKSSQNWSLFRSPHMLVRKETVDLATQMRDAIEKKETLRLVVTGNRGSGKSILGLQALTAGFLNKWVVVNIPEGRECRRWDYAIDACTS